MQGVVALAPQARMLDALSQSGHRAHFLTDLVNFTQLGTHHTCAPTHTQCPGWITLLMEVGGQQEQAIAIPPMAFLKIGSDSGTDRSGEAHLLVRRTYRRPIEPRHGCGMLQCQVSQAG